MIWNRTQATFLSSAPSMTLKLGSWHPRLGRRHQHTLANPCGSCEMTGSFGECAFGLGAVGVCRWYLLGFRLRGGLDVRWVTNLGGDGPYMWKEACW